MPLVNLLPAASTVANAGPGRDRAIDVARLSALVVVMFGHCALLLATIDDRGLRIGNILGELPQLTPITWVVQVMPLFFFAGGAAGAYGWHPDGSAAGKSWGSWLVGRTQRLCRPVFWYLGFWTVALLVARLTLGAESADRLGRECVALLWFLGVYLMVIAFVPALTRLRGAGATAGVLALLLAAAAGIDQIRFAVGSADAGVANFVIVWLIPVVIGVAYARGLLRVPMALLVAAAALAAQVLLAAFGFYEVSLVTTGSTDGVSNVAPPTLLLALHCVWMPCVFVALAGIVQRLAERPRVWYLVAVGNGGAMTLYLWHIPAIAVAAFSLNAVGLDAWDVHAPNFWALLALRAAVFAVVMSATFLLLSPLEHRRLPWWDDAVGAAGARSVVAGALVCVAGVAMLLVAKNGLAGPDGWIPLVCFLVAVLAARACAGVRPVR
ncbi:acyltransferase family protein [Mycolicibacterium diernhoferi]|uniref:Acetyltransferase n=1 Tax=Mycolicibacterium diernhoferi TaxID=1801 RepID=A0A1Q4H8Y2_9MYCO|nr:acyltransferase family protein [Mycolicibacterium diernhoferi]OJZ64004.1 acetyltransferase [Mycolicibacterium diernhoferi]OPE51750.1 acetyltransferase [Mycolicibacterium diernhoferi]PEG55612.1 acetyltransferase [Mycolicibacterium diernhoferi]QYL20690.1 acyltransferase family protein [Mycolicibacterium diernhoferi]